MSTGSSEPTENRARVAFPPTASRPPMSPLGTVHDSSAKPLYSATTGSRVNRQVAGVQQPGSVHPMGHTHRPVSSHAAPFMQSASV